MKRKRLKPTPPPTPYNQEVRRAFFKLLKITKALIANVERHELRCTYQLSGNKAQRKQYEFVSPLVYLSLEGTDTLEIYFGFEMLGANCEYSPIIARFLRMLYKLTAVENTKVNIEDCISTNYVVTECSELFEAVDDSRTKQHSFKLIPYKPTPAKRKEVLKVA